MGRNITQSTKTSVSPIAALDSFGTGKVELFTNSGTFVVPEGITVVRARCFGGGGGGWNGTGTAGGTSSFGAYCSATGGGAGLGVAPFFGAGGTGIGGDINRTGGNGGGNSGNNGGGGGVAGLFKNGGIGATGGSSGGSGNAGGGANSVSVSKAGDGILGRGSYYVGTSAGDSFLATGEWINLSIDFLGCGGGGTYVYGASNGGGGAGNNNGVGSAGAWPGGGGGGGPSTSQGGGGGGGFTIRTIVVTPGDFIAVTVGAGGTSAGSISANVGAPGCVVVEY